jgi:soluble lytic murein transglycosylase-like protein
VASVASYRPLAIAAAKYWGRALGVVVPPDLVLAVIRKESVGDPRAVRREPDGRISRGLMQVLEGTARDLGLTNPQLLHVPAIGIDVGTHYLAQQLKRYAGRTAPAVAAYNAGTAFYQDNARESFVNQTYVDDVLRFFRSFASTAPALPFGLLALGAAALAVAFLGGDS